MFFGSFAPWQRAEKSNFVFYMRTFPLSLPVFVRIKNTGFGRAGKGASGRKAGQAAPAGPRNVPGAPQNDPKQKGPGIPHGCPGLFLSLWLFIEKSIFLSYSLSRALAAWIMMAHSIRLRKSSHPYSYTPLMEPVAW